MVRSRAVGDVNDIFISSDAPPTSTKTQTSPSRRSPYLLEVVERGENDFVASSHETNCRQELQDQSFCSVKQGENKRQERSVNEKAPALQQNLYLDKKQTERRAG